MSTSCDQTKDIIAWLQAEKYRDSLMLLSKLTEQIHLALLLSELSLGHGLLLRDIESTSLLPRPTMPVARRDQKY